MTRASARHILVETQDKCEEIKKQIEGGADFAELAREHSMCPSSEDGGNLGEFLEGEMVEEFDKIVFGEEVGKIHGPIETEFGFHLVEITSRTE